MKNYVLLYAFILLFSGSAFAKVISENWYKVLSTNVHTGFIFMRTEFLESSKQFQITYLLSTNAAGGNVSESLKTISSEGLKPISYQYTSLTAGKAKTIDAVVKKDLKTNKDKLFLNITEEGKSFVKEEVLEEGSMFSSSIGLRLLTEGIKLDKNYSYKGIAEEDGTTNKGLVYIKSLETFKGKKAYKVTNDFKSVRFISFLSQDGITLATKSPELGIDTEIANTQEEATKGLVLPIKTMESLFGKYPSKSSVQL